MIRIAIVSVSCLLISLGLCAQENHYASKVRKLYEQSDSVITAIYSKTGPLESERASAERKNGIVIAYPDCDVARVLHDCIRQTGATPFAIPPMENFPEAYAQLREMAFGWDGILMPDGWVKAEDTYSALVYKAVCDLNVPYIGTSGLTTEIDRGLRRLPTDAHTMKELFRKAFDYHHAKALMSEIFSVDTHCDLPGRYGRPGYSVGHRTLSMCSVPKMDEGHLDAQYLVSFLDQGPEDKESLRKAVELNMRQIAQIKADVNKYSGICGIARTPDEARALKAQGKKAFFLALENAYGLGNDLANVQKMADEGITYITLCHFYDNAICHSSSKNGHDPTKGLTEFGRKVVEEMNRCGIMIDLSHPSEGTFWDCIKYSKAPIICSHSGAKAIYGHDRGLDDDQLKALAENGGVIQVYMVNNFLGWDEEKSDIDLFMKHFNHCVQVAGPEHVGIGSDFDGGGGILGCNGDNDFINVTVKMIEAGYSDEQIAGFWGGNFLRVMQQVQDSVSEKR